MLNSPTKTNKICVSKVTENPYLHAKKQPSFQNNYWLIVKGSHWIHTLPSHYRTLDPYNKDLKHLCREIYYGIDWTNAKIKVRAEVETKIQEIHQSLQVTLICRKAAKKRSLLKFHRSLRKLSMTCRMIVFKWLTWVELSWNRR